MKKYLVVAVVLTLLALSLGGCAQAPKGGEVKGTANELSTDIVVIGAGGAGLTAAVTAKSAGADVIVLEKMPFIGGNTLRATGGLNAAGTKYQEAAGIEDSPDIHYADTMKGGKNKNNPELVRTLVDNANGALEWLNSMGANLVHVVIAGGSTNPRTHAPEGGAPVGPVIIRTLEKAAKEQGIQILTDTEATEILTDGKGTVTGVKAVSKDKGELVIKAKAVIVATGGFGADPEMVAQYNPALKGFDTTNHPGATGDGIKMATAIGAATVQMENIQTHPTVVPHKGILITEAVRGTGAILVNHKGERFVDELETRDVVSKAILNQEKGTAFVLFDQGVRDNLKAVEEYAKLKLLVEANTLSELAGKLGIPADNLEATVKKYNEFVAAGKDSDYGRQHLQRKLEKAPFYAVEVTPAVHHTMGGLAINTKAEVLNKDGKPIPGLYAAGEVTGGIHGANRLGGNAVADIVVFGRIAGQQAAEYVKSK
ncbi:MAG: fumarate reductase flavoprotein subunit [Bacillota bacterium]|nr:fumarate reductase flavoprotein subunit [Bacillota bacterium]